MKQLLMILAIGCSHFLSATNPHLSGLVLDAETGELLPFTTISVGGKGTVANAEGAFTLNLEGCSQDDSIFFSHVGYETLALAISNVSDNMRIRLKPAIVNLGEVAVYSRKLTAEDILELVKENYTKNHPQTSDMQRIFLHKYERAKMPIKDQVVLKKSDFVGMDKDLFQELTQKMPDEFTEYQDVLIELYSNGGEQKTIPIQGISMEEGSMQELTKELETKLSAFLEDIEKTNNKDDVYYKFRTGILAFDADMEAGGDSTTMENEGDSLHYKVGTNYIESTVDFLTDSYASLESDNWEFINKTGKYRYTLADLTVFNDEVVHKIEFSPKRGGLFEGSMYVSASTYAILQLDFEYAPGKKTENIQIFGIGHSMDFKKGRVIYQRGETGYHLKYIYAQQHEKASIERSFTFMKKEKRFFWDKTLNEIKLETELRFDITNYWELLVMEREPISQQQFEQVEEPENMELKKEYAYSPEAWENRTVIAPTAELKKYKRKE